MRLARATWATGVLIAVAAASVGCGGSRRSAATFRTVGTSLSTGTGGTVSTRLPSGAGGTVPASLPPGTGGMTATNGAVVFARNCSHCHSLVGNESRGTAGGDLVGYALPRSSVFEYTREMPTPHPLTREELEAVVNYVVGVQQR